MEFVTFTIKKSLFIIESGQTEHVQLKTSIRREGKLRIHVAQPPPSGVPRLSAKTFFSK